MERVSLRCGRQMDVCRPVRGADRLQILDSRCMTDSCEGFEWSKLPVPIRERECSNYMIS